MKKILISLLFLISVCSYSQYINIVSYSGTNSYVLSKNEVLTFKSTGFKLTNTSYFNYIDTKKIYFGDFVTVINQAKELDIQIYPNPCSSYLKILYEGNFDINIYDIKGIKVIHEKHDNESYLNASILNKGIYILNINNKTYKFLKF